MRLECICFTQRGQALAEGVLNKLGNWDVGLAQGYGKNKANLERWTAAAFGQADALLFVGAAGIAVRAVAPHVRNKLEDPAVLAVDEAGRFVIPLLGGHAGGANRLARQLAQLTGGQAALTTATDVRGVFAVDDWAAVQGLFISSPQQIKGISVRLLEGEEVTLHSALPLREPLPRGVARSSGVEGADILLSPYCHKAFRGLQLVPRCVWVGLGCRKGISGEAIHRAVEKALACAAVRVEAVEGVASIALKAGEQGLLDVCAQQGWKLRTYTGEELRQVAGSASASDFVRQVTGVDNVCERSALAGGGTLLLPKQTQEGVAVALALRERQYGFEEWL